MNISNLGRLIGAGLLALGLHAFSSGVGAGDPDRLDLGAVNDSGSAEPSGKAFEGARLGANNGNVSAPGPAPQR